MVAGIFLLAAHTKLDFWRACNRAIPARIRKLKPTPLHRVHTLNKREAATVKGYRGRFARKCGCGATQLHDAIGAGNQKQD